MTEAQKPPTPEQARAQLDSVQARSLGSRSDRGIHAAGTAALGLTVGLFMAGQQATTNRATGLALSGAFVAICLAEGIWVERAARTVPRRARMWSRVGFGASFGLALLVVLPALNLLARQEPITLPVVLLAAIVVAAPSLGAAAVMTRGRV